MTKNARQVRFQARSYGRFRITILTALLFVLGTAVVPRSGRASVALLMEEPFGEFGAFNPTGHAAVYLNHVCADTPTQLRRCNPGEYGSVISRYHKVAHEDWVAVPLVPYLYAVDSLKDVPAAASREDEKRLREQYWATHLSGLVPGKGNGKPPGGEWIQLVGSSYDRKIHGFQADTTQDQDDALIAYFNDRRNRGHFNLFFHNCADFSRSVLDLYFPDAIHRAKFADFGLTTPKQVARSLVKYSTQHPELHMSAFVIDQVPGSIPRSHPIRGVAESLVRSKRYLIPLAILEPEFAGVLAADYLVKGRTGSSLPKNAPIFNIGDVVQPEPDAVTTATSAPAAPATQSTGHEPGPGATGHTE